LEVEEKKKKTLFLADRWEDEKGLTKRDGKWWSQETNCDLKNGPAVEFTRGERSTIFG